MWRDTLDRLAGEPNDLTFSVVRSIWKSREAFVFLFHCFQRSKTSSCLICTWSVRHKFSFKNSWNKVPIVKGMFQFPSVIPGIFCCCFKEVEEGWGDTEECNTIGFFFKEIFYIYMCIWVFLCVYVCVCIQCNILSWS